MFIGYPRSGHSLVGALLNAHHNMVIAHELDALRYVRMGFGADDLFALLFDRERQFARQGREWYEYDYNVPGQWQGRFDEIRVIGDKKGGASTFHLREDPGLLDQLRSVLPCRLRVIHMVRNPFDNIATSFRRTGNTLPDTIGSYFARCGTNAEIMRRLDRAEILQMRHESMVGDPKAALRVLCEFLGVDCRADYQDDCASIVFEKPRHTRYPVPWTDRLLDEVRAQIDRYEFLDGYAFGLPTQDDSRIAGCSHRAGRAA